MTRVEILDREHEFYVYHGTIETSANAINDEGFKVIRGKRNNHWLGEGVYFFREDPEQALAFAIPYIKTQFRGQKVAVFETKIKVHNTKILNLDTRHGLEIFRNHVEDVLNTLEQHNVKINTDDGRDENQRRHLMFSQLPEEEYQVIQRTFTVPSKFFDNFIPFKLIGQKISEDQNLGFPLHGTQICVRDISVLVQKPVIVKWYEESSISITKKRGKGKSRNI